MKVHVRNAERTAALGVSASGEFALALGLQRPREFGAVLCACRVRVSNRPSLSGMSFGRIRCVVPPELDVPQQPADRRVRQWRMFFVGPIPSQ